MKMTNALFLKGDGQDDTLSIPLPLQGEAQGGGMLKGGVTRNASSKTLGHAKSLRRSLTEVENRLWYQLRAKRFSQFKFRRQHAIGYYIVDFACLKSKLIIELDGGQHSIQQAYDAMRDAYLRKEGFTVLRFWNNELTENMEGVLGIILETLSPTLSLKGEGEGDALSIPLPLKGEAQGGGDSTI